LFGVVTKYPHFATRDISAANFRCSSIPANMLDGSVGKNPIEWPIRKRQATPARPRLHMLVNQCLPHIGLDDRSPIALASNAFQSRLACLPNGKLVSALPKFCHYLIRRSNHLPRRDRS